VLRFVLDLPPLDLLWLDHVMSALPPPAVLLNLWLFELVLSLVLQPVVFGLFVVVVVAVGLLLSGVQPLPGLSLLVRLLLVGLYVFLVL